jgi:hypothetical protein
MEIMLLLTLIRKDFVKKKFLSKATKYLLSGSGTGARTGTGIRAGTGAEIFPKSELEPQ